MEFPFNIYIEIFLFLIIPTGILIYGAIKLKQSIKTTPTLLILLGSLLLLPDTSALLLTIRVMLYSYFPSSIEINIFEHEQYLVYPTTMASFILLGVGFIKLSKQLNKIDKLSEKE